jgi:hypothetical protein
MKRILLHKKMLAVACSLALFLGLSLTTGAEQQKNKKKKQQQKQLVRQLRHPDKTEHEQRFTVYRQRLNRQQPVYQQSFAQLQREKRLAQLRYQRRYAALMAQQQRRYQNMRTLNYQNDPYFRTPYDRRYNRGGAYYETNRYGEAQLQQAVQYGYAEGYRAGVADRQDRWRADYGRSVAYMDANYGYNGYYVSLDDYSYYFREGFRRGYEDGYNRRYQYGRSINGSISILGAVLAGIVAFEILR